MKTKKTKAPALPREPLFVLIRRGLAAGERVAVAVLFLPPYFTTTTTPTFLLIPPGSALFCYSYFALPSFFSPTLFFGKIVSYVLISLAFFYHTFEEG